MDISKSLSMYKDQSGIDLNHLLFRRHPVTNTALIYDTEEGVTTLTFGELDFMADRIASQLQKHGIEKGSRVAILLPKCPELMGIYAAVWRLGAIAVPLFTAFGPDALLTRIEDAGVSCIVTNTNQSVKFDSRSSHIPKITFSDEKREHYKIISSNSQKVSSARPENASIMKVAPDDPILLLYTSGTTGKPKGVKVPAWALASFHVYMEAGLGLVPFDPALSVIKQVTVSTETDRTSSANDQVYMNAADPAWAYGLYYNLIGPLLLGIPSIYLGGNFDARNVFRALAEYRVTHFAASPTLYRSLKAYENQSSDDVYLNKILSKISESIKCTSSAGEPLNPEVISWWKNRVAGGGVIADHYGQSEAGMMVNWHWLDSTMHQSLNTDNKSLNLPMVNGKSSEWVIPGSMGRSMHGFRAVVLNSDGNEVVGESGSLAIDIRRSPLMWFNGYWKNEAKSASVYSMCGQYYLTGDVATLQSHSHAAQEDESHVLWFSSRDDDVITSSGYRIGPFDVESTLLQDSRVSEAAVVGIPDPEGLRGEVLLYLCNKYDESLNVCLRYRLLSPWLF